MDPADPADPATAGALEPQAPAVAGATSGLSDLRRMVSEATQRLLGATMTVGESEWRAPSRLPGWSRGHVATHVARQADGIVRLVTWARTGQRLDMYPSPAQREADIDSGAGRRGMELQVDLDSSAEQLTAAFETLDWAGTWDRVVQLRGGTEVPARLLPLARLTEVVLHHVDLDVGMDMADVDEQTAEWLLEWCAFRLRARHEFPRLQLRSRSGFRLNAGSSGAERTVTGSTPQLLGWLTGRTSPDELAGTDGLVLPSF